MTDRSADPIAGRVAPSSILKLMEQWRDEAIGRRDDVAGGADDAVYQRVIRAQAVIYDRCANELEAALADPPVPSVGKDKVRLIELSILVGRWAKLAGHPDPDGISWEEAAQVIESRLKADPPVGDVERRASEASMSNCPTCDSPYRDGLGGVQIFDDIRPCRDVWHWEQAPADLRIRAHLICGESDPKSQIGMVPSVPNGGDSGQLPALGDVERPVGRLGTKDEDKS